MRLWNRKHLLSFCALAILLGACTRKTSDTTTVKLSFAGVTTNGKAEAQAAATTPPPGSFAEGKIQVITLNISGSDISEPVFYQWSGHGDKSASAPTPPDTISLSVPRGDNRLIQALVVSADSTGSNLFYYKDTVQSFNSDSSDVSLTLERLNAATSAGDASIAGKYLNAAGVGPTSRIRIYLPIPGHPERPQMLVDQSNMMIAGWFRVFSLDGGRFNYLLDDGSNMFGGAIGVDSDSLLAISTDSIRNARVFVPSFYRDKFDGGAREANPASRSIYGWFGPGAVNSGKKICIGQAIESVNNAYTTDTGGTSLRWNFQSNVGVVGDAFVETVNGLRGGWISSAVDADGLCTIAGKVKFIDYIPLADKLLADHDPILGFKGPFQLIFDGTNSSGTTLKASLANGSLTASLLFMPGVQTSTTSAGVDGVDLFGRIETQTSWNGNQDYNGDGDGASVLCSQLSSLPRPFTYLTTQVSSADPNYAVNITANSLPAAFQSAFASGMTTLIACPYTTVAGKGKSYLGVGAVHYPGGMMDQDHLQATSFKVFGPQESNTPTLANNVCTPFHMDFLNGASPAWVPNGAMISFTANNPTQLKFYKPPISVSFCSSGEEITTPIPFNGTRMDFYVMSVNSGASSQPFKAQVTGLPDVTETVTAMDQPTINEQIQIHVPASIKAFACVPFYADTWDSTNQVVVNIPGNENYTLNSTDFEFYMAGANYGPCQYSGSPNINFSNAPAVNHVSGYFRYVGPSTGPVSIAPTGGSCPQCTGGTVTVVTQPTGGVAKAVIDYSSTIGRGECTQMSIDLTDANGNPTPSGGGNLNFLSSDGVGLFYQYSGCSTGIVTSMPLAATQSHLSVWFKTAGPVGTNTITVMSAAPVVNQTVSVVVTSAKAHHFDVILPGQTFVPGTGVTGTPTVDFVNPNTVTIYAVTFDEQIDSSFSGTTQALQNYSNATNLPAAMSFASGMYAFTLNATAPGFFMYSMPLPYDPSASIYGSW